MLDDIHQLHLRLLMPGKVGSNIVFVSNLFLVWLIASGLYLWWPLKRVKVKFGASLRRVMFDLHSAVGFYSFVFLFVLALTGAFVHFDNALESLLNKAAHVSDPLRGAPSNGCARGEADRPGPGARNRHSGVAGDQGEYPVPACRPQGLLPLEYVLPGGPDGQSQLGADRSVTAVKCCTLENSRTAPFGNKMVLENRRNPHRPDLRLSNRDSGVPLQLDGGRDGDYRVHHVVEETQSASRANEARARERAGQLASR